MMSVANSPAIEIAKRGQAEFIIFGCEWCEATSPLQVFENCIPSFYSLMVRRTSAIIDYTFFSYWIRMGEWMDVWKERTRNQIGISPMFEWWMYFIDIQESRHAMFLTITSLQHWLEHIRAKIFERHVLCFPSQLQIQFTFLNSLTKRSFSPQRLTRTRLLKSAELSASSLTAVSISTNFWTSLLSRYE